MNIKLSERNCYLAGNTTFTSQELITASQASKKKTMEMRNITGTSKIFYDSVQTPYVFIGLFNRKLKG